MRLYITFFNVVTSALISQRNGTSEIDFEAFWEPVMYNEAEKACKDKGMVLATIKNDEENKKLTDYLENFTRQKSLTGAAENRQYWIGLRREISNPKLWFWDGDKPKCKLTNNKGDRFWGIDPPEGVGGGDMLIKCVRMHINDVRYSDRSNWVAHRCDWPQGTTGYVCQKPNKSEVKRLNFLKFTPYSGLCAKKTTGIETDETDRENPDEKKEPDSGSTLVTNMLLLILFIAA